ncbi:MAG: OmpH family outer membrane protein [Bacteroidetes bacterium]|nr:OmpH family outer membrane protein [Bacteroidota bacterium]
MTKKIFFFLLFIFAFLFSVSGKQTIAAFNSDTVLQTMPEYAKVQDSLEKLKVRYDSIYNLILKEYGRKVSQLATDSAKMSPLIKQIRKKEIGDIASRTLEYQFAVEEELRDQRIKLLIPLYERIKIAAETIRKKNNYLAVTDNKEGLMITSVNIQLVNITKAMIEELKTGK